jgi:hypothetical protein
MDRKTGDEEKSEYPKAVASRSTAIARGLGLFSIALGVVEVLAPRAVARAAGIDSNPNLIRVRGLQEIVCGLGILTVRKSGPFLWARVMGDGLDISGVTAAARTTSTSDRPRIAASLVALTSVTALDVYAATSIDARDRLLESRPLKDYRSRSGFPTTPQAMRGAALTSFIIPDDMATPRALRSFTRGSD